MRIYIKNETYYPDLVVVAATKAGLRYPSKVAILCRHYMTQLLDTAKVKLPKHETKKIVAVELFARKPKEKK